MESINKELRVALIESTLLEDQQSKFKSMMESLKNWIIKAKERLQKMATKLAGFVKTKLSKIKQAPKNPKMTEKQAKKIIDAEATLKEASKSYTKISKKSEDLDLGKINAEIEQTNESMDKVLKDMRKNHEDFINLISNLKNITATRSESVSESSDGYRNQAKLRIVQAAFSKSDSLFKVYLQISKFIVKDIGRTLQSIKGNIKLCEQVIIDREREERAKNGKMLEAGKSSRKISFSKKIKIYYTVIGVTLSRVSKQFLILVEVTNLVAVSGVAKGILKTAETAYKYKNKKANA